MHELKVYPLSVTQDVSEEAKIGTNFATVKIFCLKRLGSSYMLLGAFISFPVIFHDTQNPFAWQAW